MSNPKCEFCGDDINDCNCDGLQDWYTFSEFKPNDGQTCRIVQTIEYDAIYNPKSHCQWVILDQHLGPETTLWRPINR